MKRLFVILLALVLIAGLAAGCGPKAPAEAEPINVTAEPEEAEGASSSSLTPAQEMWSGQWFGYMWVTAPHGAYDHLDGVVYDAHMFVDLDANDEGTLAISFEDDDYFAIEATVIADDYHIEVVEGLFWDSPIDARLWWARASEDYEGTLIIFGDVYVDPEGDGGFDYMIVLRPWGELWDQEIERGERIPPGYEAYLAALESGGGGGGGGDAPSAPATSGGGASGNAARSEGAAGTLTVSVPSGWADMPFESAMSDGDPYGIRVFWDTGDSLDYVFSPTVVISVFFEGQVFEAQTKKSDFTGVTDVKPVTLGNYTWNGFTGTENDYLRTVIWADDGKDVIKVVIDMNNSKGPLSLDDADVKAIISSIALSR